MYLSALIFIVQLLLECISFAEELLKEGSVDGGFVSRGAKGGDAAVYKCKADFFMGLWCIHSSISSISISISISISSISISSITSLVVFPASFSKVTPHIIGFGIAIKIGKGHLK
ncbi:MAG: hypothetical protein CMB73_05470 [Euryarchaeota archaeon]|nr:hypothetical protein [Euryarchaeota archaeon]